MLEGYDFWLIALSVLVTSITLYHSCSFIKRIYLSAPADRATLLPIYSVSIGCMLFCMDNLNWVAMNPIVGNEISVPMILGSLFAAIFVVFIVFANASEKSLPFSILINRAFIVGLSSYAMFYLSFVSRHPVNDISVNAEALFTALFAATCTGCIVIFYYFKLKSYINHYSLRFSALLSSIVGCLIVVLYAIFNTTLTVQQTILGGAHALNNREIIATVFSLCIVGLLILTYTAPRYLEKIKAQLAKLHLLDSHHLDNINAKDALTQLANRHGFKTQLNAAIKRSTRIGNTIALAYIDLDHFKPINDQYGHHVGDAVLKVVAQRLQTAVRGCDSIARLGGDEFAALLENITKDSDIIPIVERIVSSINLPFYINNQQFEISCSVGIALHHRDGDIDKLMVCADSAMYKAKQNGKNQFKFYDADIELSANNMLQMQGDLRNAIDYNQFVLMYQPKLDCNTQLFVGAEALIRWNHPSKGLLMPKDFIPVAEHCGLIDEINDWVAEQACKTISQAKLRDINLNLSINTSNHLFRNKNLVSEMIARLEKYKIATNSLTMEIKETSGVRDEALFNQHIAQLKAAGIKIALDDFGLHPFTLSYLQALNVDEIKIDKIFMAKVKSDPESWKLVDILINLANLLHINVVAEGIENEVQHNMLKQLGCNHMQGYLFSEAITERNLYRYCKQHQLNVPARQGVEIIAA